MTEDENPVAPLPAATQPSPSAEEIAPAAGAGLGPLGMTLIGGAVAAVGIAIALPFLRRRKPKASGKTRGRPKPPKNG
jgi:hypothetical protein